MRNDATKSPPGPHPAWQDWPAWGWLMLALLIGLLALVLLTFQDYGVTYDEAWNAEYGARVLRWYESAFRERGALNYWNLVNKGGFSVLVLELAARTLPLEPFEARHLAVALFGVLGVGAAYQLGRLLHSSLAGFAAALILASLPTYYGHSFINYMDIPFAALHAWALYFIIRLIYALPRPGLGLVILTGIVTGLALGVRIAGVTLLLFLGLGMAAWYVGAWLRQGSDLRAVDRRALWRLLIYLALVSGVAYVTMVAFWPAAQVDPITRPLKALFATLEHDYIIEVFFDGQFIPGDQLPWYYLPKYLLLTLPEYLILLLGVGAVFLACWCWKFRRKVSLWLAPGRIGIGLLVAAGLMPVLTSTLLKPIDYDGTRHYLFIFPPLSILAGISLAHLAGIIFPEAGRQASRVVRWGSALLLSLVLATWCVTLLDMLRLHPNQYLYFNRAISGGMAAAAQSYDMDYWGNSYREAVEWLVDNPPSSPGGQKIKVVSCLHSASVEVFLPMENFEYLGSFHNGKDYDRAQPADIFLASPRWRCDQELTGVVLHRVERLGAPLVTIIAVTP